MAETDIKLLSNSIQQQLPYIINQSTQMASLVRVMYEVQRALNSLGFILRNLQNSFISLSAVLMRIAKVPQASINSEGKSLKQQFESTKGIVAKMVMGLKDGFQSILGEKELEKESSKDPSKNLAKAGKAMTGIGAQLGSQLPQMMAAMFIMKPIMDLLQGVLTAFEPLLELFGVFGEIIGTAFAPLVNQLMVMILPAIPFLVDLMQKLAPIIQFLWNFMTPIGLLIQFFTHFDLIINEFQKAFTEVGKAFVEVGKAFTDAGSFIMGILNAIGNGFSVVFGEIGKAFETFVNGIKGIINFLLGGAFGGKDRDIFTPV